MLLRDCFFGLGFCIAFLLLLRRFGYYEYLICSNRPQSHLAFDYLLEARFWKVFEVVVAEVAVAIAEVGVVVSAAAARRFSVEIVQTERIKLNRLSVWVISQAVVVDFALEAPFALLLVRVASILVLRPRRLHHRHRHRTWAWAV
jgi:hypothetical protein